ncbi:hypothetical protein, partial [Caballeronia temeraria]|uniref:hypothetical protein n=1 Tax=Caballeronia temeraria TaxID=1777137 RepID=UPI000AD3A931
MIGLDVSIWRRASCALAPTLSLDFTKAPGVPAGWTFSRASNATYFDVNGVMQTAAPNVARFDHEPV